MVRLLLFHEIQGCQDLQDIVIDVLGLYPLTAVDRSMVFSVTLFHIYVAIFYHFRCTTISQCLLHHSDHLQSGQIYRALRRFETRTQIRSSRPLVTKQVRRQLIHNTIRAMTQNVGVSRLGHNALEILIQLV